MPWLQPLLLLRQGQCKSCSDEPAAAKALFQQGLKKCRSLNMKQHAHVEHMLKLELAGFPEHATLHAPALAALEELDYRCFVPTAKMLADKK